VLIIDDEDRYAELCHRLLPRYHYLSGCGVANCPPCPRDDCTQRNAHDWREARALLTIHRGAVDVVLLDLRFDLPAARLVPEGLPESGPLLERAKRLQGIEILTRIRREFGDVPVILMTRHDDVPFEDMADALRASDYTYLAADEGMNLRALEAQIDSIVARRRAERVPEGNFFWGESEAMAGLQRRLELLALGDRPVLVMGETGTGKSYFVRQMLHRASGRRGPFVQLDLASLPETLIASELFGTAPGAFSGAVSRPGAFEHANGGTLFLDEIGNLPPEAQRRLLTVLQEREVTRLGENKPRKLDVKICAATNAFLEDEVQRGRFRSDLYMRLNPAARIELPPLRSRRADILPLASHLTQRIFQEEVNAKLLTRYAEHAKLSGPSSAQLAWKKSKSGRGLRFVLSEKSAQELVEHAWPGNVRQLEMVLANVLLLTLLDALASGGGGLASGDLPVSPKAVRELLQKSGLGIAAAREEKAPYSVSVTARRTLHEAARGWEAEIYQALYQETKGEFPEMARRLLGDGSPASARRVQLRFNQLGLRVRGEPSLGREKASKKTS
jgi:two-component system nitrogen regulation response regulator GlnG